MPDPIRDLARRMAREGKTIRQISEELGIDYSDAWGYVPGSWQGMKKMITNRINKLINEKDRSVREQLAFEVQEYVDSLYYSGKHLSRMVDRIRNTLSD